MRLLRDLFPRAARRLFFASISVANRDRLPLRGPVLYVGLHRNGAVDGFVYNSVVPNAEFLISVQLTRSWLGRLFFRGIGVVRTKDAGDRAGNEEALRRCVQHLQDDGELFVLPEGTSSLGPRPLPFKRGAARILAAFLETGRPIQVVPMGIHYSCAWCFRSRVDVVIGEPIATELPTGLAFNERVRLLHERISAALLALALNVETSEHQHRVEGLANLAERRAGCRHAILKKLERTIPSKVERGWQELCTAIGPRWRYEGVPWVSRTLLADTVALAMLLPVVLLAIVANIVPLLAAYLAARKLADDVNVVALWRILVGIPVGVLWAVLIAFATLPFGYLALAAYLLVTAAGLSAYPRAVRSVIALRNRLRHPGLVSCFSAICGELDGVARDAC